MTTTEESPAVVPDFGDDDERLQALQVLQDIGSPELVEFDGVVEGTADASAVEHLSKCNLPVDFPEGMPAAEEAGLADLKTLIMYGVSPRGTIMLTQAARARAFLEGRGYVTPHDIQSMALSVLRHRVAVSYEAEAEEITSDQIVRRIFETVEVP